MPNWCQNELQISASAETIQAIKTLTGLDKQAFSFQAIHPMPEALDIPKSSAASWGADVLAGDWQGFVERFKESLLEISPELPKTREVLISLIQAHAQQFDGVSLALGEQALKNRTEYGFDDWYDWRIANWGCKWDIGEDVQVISLEETAIHIGFDTPWSPPVGVMQKLCERFPDIELSLSYAETGCWFAGQVLGSSGQAEDCPVLEEEVKSFCTQHFGTEFDDEEDCEEEREESQKNADAAPVKTH